MYEPEMAKKVVEELRQVERVAEREPKELSPSVNNATHESWLYSNRYKIGVTVAVVFGVAIC